MSCCFQSAVLDFTCSALLSPVKLGLGTAEQTLRCRPLQTTCFFYCCLEMLLVAPICKLSAQVSKSVRRRRGHVYALHARFAPQLCWREGGRLSRRLRCEIRPSHILLLSLLFFIFFFFCRAADVWSTPPKKTADRPVYPACFPSKGPKLNGHRYQGGTGEVWLFSAWVVGWNVCVRSVPVSLEVNATAEYPAACQKESKRICILKIFFSFFSYKKVSFNFSADL